MTKTINCAQCTAALPLKGKSLGIVRCDYCGADNKLDAEVRRIMVENTYRFSVALRESMVHMLSLEDVQMVAQRLNIDYENLSGAKNLKVLNLIQYCQRRGMLQDLVDQTLLQVPVFTIDL